MIRETYALLSEEALENNYHLLRDAVPKEVFFCPMVKCDAYGHGAVEVSLRLQKWGCEQVGVVSVEEARQLRAQGFQRDILIFGHVDQKGWSAVEEGGFVPVMVSLRELEQLKSSGVSCRFHIKFNTGLNRLGVRREDLQAAMDLVQSMSKAQLVGLCTHMVQAADIGEGPRTAEQLNQFEKVMAAFAGHELVFHAFNSIGHFRTLQFHPAAHPRIGVRPGLALYGVPLPEEGPAAEKLKPVMSLYSKVVHVQRIKKGEIVSYDGLWAAPKDSVIGVIPVGYGDGLPWALRNWRVRVGENLVPIVGKICMDHIMVDLTNHSAAVYEQTVEIFGPHLSVRELAEQASTIPYEVLTGINSRVERVWERPKP